MLSVSRKIVIVLGPPGSGKGTACEEFAKRHRYLHLSTGDICREEVDLRTELGLQIEKFMEQSMFVPDRLMFQGTYDID
jgi:adenylate kinase